MASATGKWQLPFGLMLEESKLDIPGSVSSYEIEDGKHPLLISQSVQATAGMVKNVRAGTITLQDCDQEHIEVVRQMGTGLFMIRVDHLVMASFLRDYASADEEARTKGLMIDQPLPPTALLSKQAAAALREHQRTGQAYS